MKAAVFALLFVLFQTCYTQDLPAEVKQSIDNCASSTTIAKERLLLATKEVFIIEDDEELQKFFECYVKDLGLIDAQGNHNEARIVEVTESMLKLQMQGVPDGDAKAHRIATLAVEHCKTLPKDGPLGLVAIKHRNCARAFISNPQLLSN